MTEEVKKVEGAEEAAPSEGEFKAKTTEELLDPQAYRASLRNARSGLLDHLHRVTVDLDLLQMDPAAAENPTGRDPVIKSLGGQVESLTYRINEIDRRLEQGEKGDKATMEPPKGGGQG